MKRKYTGILLLGLWIFQSFTAFLFYEIERMECHIQNFSKNNFVRHRKEIRTFSLSKQEQLYWVVPGKEFLMHGHLYDVVTLSETGDSITIHCYPDTKEDSIVANFHNFIKGKSKQGNPYSKLKKVSISKYISNEIHFLLKRVPFEKTIRFKDDPKRYSCFIEIIPPPPRGLA